jgi:hypothetical protein
MNGRSISGRAVLGVLILLAAGCAATPMVDGRIAADLAPYTMVQVLVEPDPAVRGAHGYDVTAAELAQQFIDNVRAGGKAAVPGPGFAEGRVLEAKLTIRSLSYVSGAGRGMGGIMAGRAVLAVTMTLTDKQTGAVLGAANAQHSSSHGQGVFSPTTARQVTAIAKELASRVTKQ